MNDHDLLIKLHVLVEAARLDIKELSTNLVSRVLVIEQHHYTKLEVEDRITGSAKSIRDEFELKMINLTAETSRLGKIVYGACGLVLIAFMTALLK